MPLTGTYIRNLDEKQRLAVPKRLRVQFSTPEPTSLYVTPESEGSLGLYAPDAFERLAARLEAKSTNRNYLRLFYARSEQVDLDNQGRIRIPERLAAYAQLKHNLVLVGVHDHAELWDQDVWEAFLERHTPEFDQMANDALKP